MKPHLLRSAFLVFLALVFTIGLTFATVELPYAIDGALQRAIATPEGDSHAGAVDLLRTELFIAHYHLRAVGYACFAVMVLLIVAGFATRKTGLATLGALAFMLPVFAQFAGVMFFLAGLGLLNVLWLPALDISFGLSRLGLIVRAPFDGAMWSFRQLGANAYWPLVWLAIGGGLLLFFLGTLAWLSARARDEGVARSWVYRISRHPQYLGWIIWSYGVYLLLLQARYPKRSWGIDASLPWLISTTVIIGVAMLEEVGMRRRHGQAYAAYRRSAPFLFPVPAFVARLFNLPLRVLFGKQEPERRREVAAVVVLYTAGLIALSGFFYGGWWCNALNLVMPVASQEAKIAALGQQLVEEPNRRTKYFIARRLTALGEPATGQLLRLLGDDQAEVRQLAAEGLGEIGAQDAAPALIQALGDPEANVRWKALSSLAAMGRRDAIGPTQRLLDDAELWLQRAAVRALAELGAHEALEPALELLQEPELWVRVSGAESLGILGSAEAVPALVERLDDEEPRVRRAVVLALLGIGAVEARPALERAREDEDWEVRVYAAEAVKRINPPPASP